MEIKSRRSYCKSPFNFSGLVISDDLPCFLAAVDMITGHLDYAEYLPFNSILKTGDFLPPSLNSCLPSFAACIEFFRPKRERLLWLGERSDFKQSAEDTKVGVKLLCFLTSGNRPNVKLAANQKIQIPFILFWLCYFFFLFPSRG